jgi:2'-5' RNA ligase
MRTFIGLEFDDKLKEKLFTIQNILKADTVKGSWVNDSNFHMTLKFLGEIKEEQIYDIGDMLENIAYSYSPIQLSLDELGYFNRKNEEYGVIWISLKNELLKLNQIYDIIEKEVQTIGFEIDTRRFKPHITIGRRIIINKPFNEIKEIVKDELKYDFILDNLALMKSEEIMNKRVYTSIKSYKLGNNLKNNHR